MSLFRNTGSDGLYMFHEQHPTAIINLRQPRTKDPDKLTVEISRSYGQLNMVVNKTTGAGWDFTQLVSIVPFCKKINNAKEVRFTEFVFRILALMSAQTTGAQE